MTFIFNLIEFHPVDGDLAALFGSHFGLLAFLMIIGSFLHFPFVSRLIIITATPLNFYLKLTSGTLRLLLIGS